MLASSGSGRLQVLLEDWISCRGEWRQSKLYEKITSRKSCRTYGARVWLTKSQIMAKYGGDEAVANDIISTKTETEEARQTQTKPHPDAPKNKAQVGGGFVFDRCVCVCYH